MRSYNAAPLTAASFTIAIVALTPLVAFAEEAAPISIASGKPSGVLAGAILATLVGYALWLLAKPSDRDRDLKRVLLVLSGLLVLKAFALHLFAGFSVDLGTYEAWALKIATLGPARTYQEGYFLDYPPGYLYALWAAGAFANAVGVSGGEALKVIVQMPPLIGDFLLSIAVYLFVRRTRTVRYAWIALALVALNPAFIFDSVVWGQTDSPIALALFLSVAMMIDGEYEVGWGLAALAVLIKPQALSLMPVLGVWTLLRLEPRKWWRAALAFVASRGDRSRAVPDRPSVELASRTLFQRCRLLQRDLGQRVQPDGTDWRIARTGCANRVRRIVFRHRDDGAGAAVCVHRMDAVARA